MEGGVRFAIGWLKLKSLTRKEHVCNVREVFVDNVVFVSICMTEISFFVWNVYSMDENYLSLGGYLWSVRSAGTAARELDEFWIGTSSLKYETRIYCINTPITVKVHSHCTPCLILLVNTCRATDANFPPLQNYQSSCHKTSPPSLHRQRSSHSSNKSIYHVDESENHVNRRSIGKEMPELFLNIIGTRRPKFGIDNNIQRHKHHMHHWTEWEERLKATRIGVTWIRRRNLGHRNINFGSVVRSHRTLMLRYRRNDYGRFEIFAQWGFAGRMMEFVTKC